MNTLDVQGAGNVGMYMNVTELFGVLNSFSSSAMDLVAALEIIKELFLNDVGVPQEFKEPYSMLIPSENQGTSAAHGSQGQVLFYFLAQFAAKRN